MMERREKTVDRKNFDKEVLHKKNSFRKGLSEKISYKRNSHEKKHRIEPDSGISLAIVICISALFMAFALAMVYAAGLLLANANARDTEERCYQLAKSYASVVDAELTDASNTSPSVGTEFYLFANRFLKENRYQIYDPANPENTTYSYVGGMEGISDAYGKITIRLRKENNEEESSDELSGTLLKTSENGNYTEIVNEVKTKTFSFYIFTVDIVAEADGLSYNYSTEYYRQDQYPVEFYYDGSKVVWNESDNLWHKDTEAGEAVTIRPEEDLPLTYRYITTGDNSPLACTYINIYKEGGIPE